MNSDSYLLSQLCEIYSGGTPRRGKDGFYGGDILWAKIADLNSPDHIVENTEETLTELGLKQIGRPLFPKDTILLAMYGSIGKIAVAGKQLMTNQAILGIQIAKQEKLNQRYLFRWLQAKKSSLESLASGVTQKNITAKIVRDLEIKLPSLAEQRRIASILDKADVLLAKQRRALELLDNLVQSVFFKMFGDPVRNELSWESMKLKAAVTYISSGITPTGGSAAYQRTGFLFIRSQNVRMLDFDFSEIAFISEKLHAQMKRTWVKNGDVLFNITGASIGRVNFYGGPDDEANVNQHVCILRPKPFILPEFLAYQLGNASYQAKVLGKNQGATRQAFNYQQIKDFDLILPPLETQKRFAAFLSKNQQQRENYRKSYRGLENLFASLQANSFSNK